MVCSTPTADPAEGDPTLQGTGRHLTRDELFAWVRFIEATRLVEEMVARHLGSWGMNISDYEVLVRLDGSGGAMRLTTLAEQCVSSKSKLTHTLNRLEQRSWIDRRPVTTDKRGLEAVITAAGSKALADASVGHASLVREHVLARWTPPEQRTIGELLDRLTQHLRANRPP